MGEYQEDEQGTYVPTPTHCTGYCTCHPKPEDEDQ